MPVVAILFTLFALPVVAVVDRSPTLLVVGVALLAILGAAGELTSVRTQLADGSLVVPRDGVSGEEWFVVLWSLPYHASFNALLAGIVYGGVGLIVRTGSRIVGGDWPDQSIAFWVMIGLCGLLTAVYAALQVEETAAGLFSRTAGLDSPYLQLAQRTRRMLVAVLLAGVVVGGAVALFWENTVFSFVYLTYAFYATSAPSQVEPEQSVADEADDLIARFEGIGLAARHSLRTGDPGVDPLLGGADVYVESDDPRVGFLVRVARPDAGSPVPWTEGSQVVHARGAFVRSELADRDTEAVVVLPVGAEVSQPLRTLAEVERLAIVVSGPDGELVVSGTEHEDLVRTISAVLYGTDAEVAS